MSRIYRLSKPVTRVLYKIRHHKGHGIHSPFVFNFINRVIEEKTSYYAYEDIAGYLRLHSFSYNGDNKINTLSFRTANYFNAENILELGSGEGLNTLFITSVSQKSKCLSVETDSAKRLEAVRLYEKWRKNVRLTDKEFPEPDFSPDCIFINLRNYKVDNDMLIPYLLSHVNEDSFIFVDGIRTNRKQKMLWKKLICREEVVISLDLFQVGILFFDKKFFKRNYKLSF